MSEDPQRIEQAVAAIEDLLYMGAIRLVDKEDRALLSPQFSLVVSNMMSSMKIDEGADRQRYNEAHVLFTADLYRRVPEDA